MAQDLKMTLLSTAFYLTSKLMFKKLSPFNTAIIIFSLWISSTLWFSYTSINCSLHITKPQNSFVKTSLVFMRALRTHSENSTPASLPSCKKCQRASRLTPVPSKSLGQCNTFYTCLNVTDLFQTGCQSLGLSRELYLSYLHHLLIWPFKFL